MVEGYVVLDDTQQGNKGRIHEEKFMIRKRYVK